MLVIKYSLFLLYLWHWIWKHLCLLLPPVWGVSFWQTTGGAKLCTAAFGLALWNTLVGVPIRDCITTCHGCICSRVMNTSHNQGADVGKAGRFYFISRLSPLYLGEVSACQRIDHISRVLVLLGWGEGGERANHTWAEGLTVSRVKVDWKHQMFSLVISTTYN